MPGRLAKHTLRNSLILGLLLLSLAFTLGFNWFGTKEKAVDFNAEVRPLLNARCLSCHGGVKRSGGFSLLFRQDALEPTESGEAAIKPGSPHLSEMIKRVKHQDPELRMPPDGDPLKEDEILLLEKWIEQGAEWEDHWAYIAPDPNTAIPEINNSWVQNDIDRFIYAKLEEIGLRPSDEADRVSLIRRLSLDLIGLPPSQEEIEAFVNDQSEDAYEKVIDRLLSSPRFGERWTAMWMDLARYADSQGYQKDRARNIWRYRDWLIKAFNEDMPFDQFTSEQLAGDLLPNATDENLIATAFHRNTMSNDEGGTDDEEFRVAAVLDRVNTTFEIWQGVTVSCVQCHSHPYDPFRHKEYYELYAFFNNSADRDLSSDVPLHFSYTRQDSVEADSLLAWLKKNEARKSDAIKKERRKNQRRLRTIQFMASTPIMEELEGEEKRTTRVFIRGNWLVHGDTVVPDVPASLPPLQDTLSRDRLALSKWLLSPENPLTSRVMVNRFWEQIFGKGLVETLEDFGTQGTKPSHPFLLDRLALDFIHKHKWSVKSLLKEIVMSATYRQSSAVSSKALQKDPYNIYLARGPRVRLTAEQLRDQVLAVSGLLSDKMYGPSVMPPQPDGVWNTIRHVMSWAPDSGENRYRRGIYTFWRRSSPYPSMTAFDAPSREFCVSRRIRTNTPLQALTTLNDSTYTEASVALSERVLEQNVLQVDEQLGMAYKFAMGKLPSKEKLEALLVYYNEALDYYKKEEEEATELLRTKENVLPEKAALSLVANVILNLDEFIVKE